ncbi:MAG: EamA family transporter [Rhodobacteraceae bacterium]|nr:EamA family transporter [Paracoccaceae bacterium]
MNDQVKGLLITTLGVLLIVPDSLFVRLIQAEPLVTSFWRGLISGLVVAIVLLVFHGTRGFRAVLRAGRPAALYIALIASTPLAFVMAVSNTSVANVVFIFASMPVFAAIFSRIFLGEPISRRMVLTMAGVMIGLAILAYGSGESEIASWKGDIWALYISVAFAGALTTVRQVRDISMVPAVPVAYIGAAILLGLFSDPMEAFHQQPGLILSHGAFIGAASCLLALGPRYISSAEVSLLVLLESVLAPLLVWFVVGEDPGSWALVGGAVVIGVLLASNLVALKKTVSAKKKTP